MKARKGYLRDKPIWTTKNWLKRYFIKRTTKKNSYDDDGMSFNEIIEKSRLSKEEMWDLFFGDMNKKDE